LENESLQLEAQDVASFPRPWPWALFVVALAIGAGAAYHYYELYSLLSEPMASVRR